MAETAELCAEIVTDGWQETVASRAGEYVTEHTWRGLFRTRRNNGCHILAALATKVLTIKKLAHNILGTIGQRLLALLGRRRFEQELARELIAKLPLPFDVKLVAVARAIQLTGILLCVAAGRDLSRCQCFVDLALTETKERVKQIMKAATDDWVNLGNFPPQQGPLSHLW